MLLYQTHALINMSHLRNNIAAIRTHIGPKKVLLISVKANAYGHGSVEVARAAQAAGVDWLGVATVPEAIELRTAGITLPILKLSPAFPEEMQAAIENRLTLTVTDQENIRALAVAHGKLTTTSKLAIHLKVDTGMGRTGVLATDAPALALWMTKNAPNLEIEGVFTHLPVSDTPADNSFTIHQLEAFKNAVAKIQSLAGVKIKLAHAANSGAILGHDLDPFNMVRAGIMAYGLYPDQESPRTVTITPVLSFRTRVSFIKRVKAGTTIGYGRTWKAAADTWVATLPVGYADGFNRLFSNRGRVLIGGRSYPVIGRVCMDQIMINVGSGSENAGATAKSTNAPVAVGDVATLIGRDGADEITSYEWAQALGTIPYEVTCQISARVPRVYDGA